MWERSDFAHFVQLPRIFQRVHFQHIDRTSHFQHQLVQGLPVLEKSIIHQRSTNCRVALTVYDGQHFACDNLYVPRVPERKLKLLRYDSAGSAEWLLHPTDVMSPTRETILAQDLCRAQGAQGLGFVCEFVGDIPDDPMTKNIPNSTGCNDTIIRESLSDPSISVISKVDNIRRHLQRAMKETGLLNSQETDRVVEDGLDEEGEEMMADNVKKGSVPVRFGQSSQN